MNMHRLEADVRARLQAPIRLASATHPLVETALDPDDQQFLYSFTTAQRKHQWLRGRQALARLATSLNLSAPLSAIHPPCPGISLTHNGKISIAAGIDNETGIGIDFESWHQISATMLRWFLTLAEQQQLVVPSNFTRLRLWTVKEALFKASYDNHQLELTDIELDEVPAMTGSARSDGTGNAVFRYTSFILRQGVLSIAIRE